VNPSTTTLTIISERNLMLVHKFGGTESVKDAERITVAAQLVAQHDRPAVAVTSALAGVTDTLIAMAEAAKERKRTIVETNLSNCVLVIRQPPRRVVSVGNTQTALLDFCRQTIDELEQLLHGVFLLRELTPRSLALIRPSANDCRADSRRRDYATRATRPRGRCARHNSHRRQFL
jgi:aspartokinase